MRNLKKSEEIILLILTAALIGLFYFQFVMNTHKAHLLYLSIHIIHLKLLLFFFSYSTLLLIVFITIWLLYRNFITKNVILSIANK